MPIPKELLMRYHETAVEYKRHECEHDVWDMLPRMAAVFRDAQFVDCFLEGVVEGHGQLLGELNEAADRPDAPPMTKQVVGELQSLIVPNSIEVVLSQVMTGEHPSVKVGDQLEAIILVTDGRASTFESEADYEASGKYERGEIHQDFENNPFSKVRELLVTQYIESDLVGGVDVSTVCQFYKRAEGNLLELEEVEYVGASDKQGGAVVDIIAPYFNGDREVTSNGS